MNQQIDPQVKGVLGLPPVSQIGVVVRDIRKAIDSYNNLFHWGPFEVFQYDYVERTYRGKPGNFKMRIALAQTGPVQFELIEPLEGENIYNDFLETRGEGLHHLGFFVDGIEERIAAMRQMGIDVLQSGKRPGVTWAYMNTEPLAGIIIELIQRKG